MSAPSLCNCLICRLMRRFARTEIGLAERPRDGARLIIRNRMRQGPSERIDGRPNAPHDAGARAEIDLKIFASDDVGEQIAKSKRRRVYITRERFWIADGREI